MFLIQCIQKISIMNGGKKLETNGKPKVAPCVDDSGWIEQQRLNGIADAESIIHPNVTYNTSAKNTV